MPSAHKTHKDILKKVMLGKVLKQTTTKYKDMLENG